MSSHAAHHVLVKKTAKVTRIPMDIHVVIYPERGMSRPAEKHPPKSDIIKNRNKSLIIHICFFAHALCTDTCIYTFKNRKVRWEKTYKTRPSGDYNQKRKKRTKRDLQNRQETSAPANAALA